MKQIGENCRYSDTCVGCRYLETDNGYDDGVVGCSAPESVTNKYAMDKKTFMKKFAIWTAVVVAVVMLILGLCFGKVIEANVWEEIGKWVLMYFPICAIFETFVYILAPLFWHIKYDGKNTGEPEALD